MNYSKSIKATLDNIEKEQKRGAYEDFTTEMGHVSVLDLVQNACYTGEDHWANGECYYDSQEEQQLAYMYAALEEYKLAYLIKEIH